MFYVALHNCVAFRDAGTVQRFTLDDCAYAPARHVGRSAWRDILATAFVPEPARLTSQDLCDKLSAICTPHSPSRKARPVRVPMKRIN